jgi:hypothetical protein
VVLVPLKGARPELHMLGAHHLGTVAIMNTINNYGGELLQSGTWARELTCGFTNTICLAFIVVHPFVVEMTREGTRHSEQISLLPSSQSHLYAAPSTKARATGNTWETGQIASDTYVPRHVPQTDTYLGVSFCRDHRQTCLGRGHG